MNEILDGYGELLGLIYEQRDSFFDDDLCIFAKGVGRKYDNRLMVVGRATNGWGNGINKAIKGHYDQVFSTLKNSFDCENLDWVLKRWGVTDPQEYNSKKSAFWRMIKALSDQLSGSSEWSIDNVVWTNLYKVAPQTGNPSGRLMNLQFQCCAKILEHEIRHHNPQNVVFLTGINWASRFLKEFGVQNELSTPQRFVKFTGSSNGVNYVVGLHPQGKPEQPHCDEIFETLNTFCPSAH